MAKRLSRQQLELIANTLACMHDSHWEEICDIKARVKDGEFTLTDASLAPALFYESRDCLEAILAIHSLDSRSNLIREIAERAERAEKRLAQIKKSAEALDKILATCK